MALQITISEEKNVVILDLAGRIDSFSIDELNAGFDKVMKTGKKNILLVMRELEYINSRGIGVLISFFKWVKRVGGLVKIAEVPLNIMQVLNLLGLDGLTLIYESSSDAIGSFRRQQLKEEKAEETGFLSEIETPPRAVRPSRSKSPYLWIGGGAVLLLLMMALFLRIGPKGTSGVDLRPIERKLDVLQERVLRMEGQRAGVPDVSGQIQDLKKHFSMRMDELGREVEKIRKVAELAQPKPAQEPTARKETTQKREMRNHSVRNGESLYRIGRRYGISVAELRRLNNLSPNKPIYPGQKLMVGYSDAE